MSTLQARFNIQRKDFSLEVDLALPLTGVTALFGASGSGKTTCLRAIAGLERPDQAYIALGEQVWQDDSRAQFVPIHRRGLGMVFQEASLFPHLSVRRNLEFGARRVPAGEQIDLDATRVIDWLDLGPLLERNPVGLSGGERQRVAIGRALLAAPRLLLLDEPLAALDLKRKQEILPYLERLRDVLSIPLLYVSHAPDEVARLADHLVLLDQGRVVASGPLSETLARLDLPEVFADDAGVVLELTLAGHEADDLSRLEFAGGQILVSRRSEALGQRLRCRIHARDVSLALQAPQASSILNSIAAHIVDLADCATPGQMLVRLEAGGVPLLARITRRSARLLALAPGMPVWAQIKGVALLP